MKLNLVKSQAISFKSTCSLNEKLIDSWFGLEANSITVDFIVSRHDISNQNLIPEDLTSRFVKWFSFLSGILERKFEVYRLMIKNAQLL